jgi:hypothetical protein
MTDSVVRESVRVSAPVGARLVGERPTSESGAASCTEELQGTKRYRLRTRLWTPEYVRSSNAKP